MYIRMFVRNAGRGRLSSECCHNENDVIMIIDGLVADGTGRRYGNWRHVATGCNALISTNLNGTRPVCHTNNPTSNAGRNSRVKLYLQGQV